MKEFYQILGVSEDATQEQIKSAYKKLALKFHPDRNKDPGAEDQFKKISVAFETLGDPEKRKRYDAGFTEDMPDVDINDIFNNMFGGGNPFSGQGGFGNLFGDMFGFGRPNNQKQKCPEKVVDIEVSIEDMFHGTKYKSFVFLKRSCSSCSGEGGTYEKCKNCDGRGSTVKTIKQGFMIQNMVQPCQTCSGQGKILKTKCVICNGSATKEESFPIEIDIAPGTPNQYKFHLGGQGEDKKDHTRGDLIINVKELKNSKFERKGHDLWTKVDISLLESLSGFTFYVHHINKKVLHLKSSEIVKHMQQNVIEGLGMPILNSNRFGNLVIEFNVIYPKNTIAKKSLMELLPDNVKHEHIDLNNKDIVPIQIKKNL